MKTLIRRLRMQGGSLVCAIPADYAHLLNLRPGMWVAVSLQTDNHIHIEQLTSPQINPDRREQRA